MHFFKTQSKLVRDNNTVVVPYLMMKSQMSVVFHELVLQPVVSPLTEKALWSHSFLFLMKTLQQLKFYCRTVTFEDEKINKLAKEFHKHTKHLQLFEVN